MTSRDYGGDGGVLVGDARLELAKAKELANVMGGAWHDDDANDLDDERANRSVNSTKRSDDKNKNDGNSTKSSGGLFSPLRRTLSEHLNGKTSEDTSKTNERNGVTGMANGKSNGSLSISHSGVPNGRVKRGAGAGVVRRPADGRAPGRRDPVAVAKAEAAAKLAAEREADAVGDPTWRLPTDVDYYTDRAALLRELVKEMPAEKRLSFQTRVANARSKEAIESLLQDFAPRLECLALPHARSREVDLQQVKKDTARERVVLDGKEIVFWESPADQPHSWHEELWATVESRVMEGLLRGRKGSKDEVVSELNVDETDEAEEKEAVVDKARALAHKEWNKARAVATTSEVFKAMSRTGAGGDAYFALVALFCTADKMVVPVHCQESPITVEFHQPTDTGAGNGNKSRGLFGSKGGNVFNKASPHGSPLSFGAGSGSGEGSRHGIVSGRGEEDVHVVVTVPSTFDIYLRDGSPDTSAVRKGSYGGGGHGGAGHASGRRRSAGNGNGVANGYDGRHHLRANGGAGSSSERNHGGTDASAAVHLVRVRAVVEEEIRVVGSSRVPASSEVRGAAGGFDNNESTAPTLRFLLEYKPRDWTRTSHSNVVDSRRLGNSAAAGLSGQRASSAPATGPMPESGAAGSNARRPSGGRSTCGSPASVSTPPPAAPAPLLTLTRTERRMRVSVVPEPSAVSEMMRSFTRKIGVNTGTASEPPRILGI